jgi:hypothetical protein
MMASRTREKYDPGPIHFGLGPRGRPAPACGANRMQRHTRVLRLVECEACKMSDAIVKAEEEAS